MDDRVTGYDVRDGRSRFDGAKMLTRIDLATPRRSRPSRVRRAVTELNRARRIAMVEPFLSRRVDARWSTT